MVEASGGVLYCWGDNSYGKTGTGSREKQVVEPCKVTGKRRWKQVSLNSHQGLAVSEEGSVFGFGLNSRQRLGLPPQLESSSTPLQVQELTLIAKVSCGYFHSLALDLHGCAFSAGNNKNGELARQSSQASFLPVET